MISRSNSRKSGNNSSGGGTLRRRMQSDPFVRKKTVRYIAIIDQVIAGIQLLNAAYRLVNYDFKDQSLLVLIRANENVFVAMLFWLGVFTLIGLQLVIAFLLLTATKDMTTDPETMIKKCRFWRTFSILLLVLVSLDLIISIYIYFVIDGETQRLAISLDGGESIFRLFGVFIVGKFLTDLHSIFANPMTTHSNSSTPPVIPRCSRTSSMNIGDAGTSSATCSRTQSMNTTSDGIAPGYLGPCVTVVERSRRPASTSVDIVPKFSRTQSVSTDHPSLSRTTSLGVAEGSVGRGSRNSDGPLLLNISSTNIGDAATSISSTCSRTQSMKVTSDGIPLGSLEKRSTVVSRSPRTSSTFVEIMPKFSRTQSICVDRPSLSRATSVGVSDGSTGRGSRNSDAPVVLNVDEGL